ncbi:ABC transporter ATP-binding protein [Sutcliffiella rhizosphaerae]|uniref:Multidrug ABC transporter ATP-binding protein YbhF n=1 Tax=Sutcliffiella rhizosphaerae TaxID=2880967 RepID=A0ABM8YJS8_9BACI|nr:ABC transporter ATP-binding protein [Sutcliffiella rhizosphaerae]CAG9620044.1 putative multidrug ABC transporter ATP-binding protein YbhF [Sutcliffiella rhizosphaerae]
MSNTVIAVQGLSIAFGKTPVLENIELNVKKGEVFGLLGPSGAGKTTLVKAIAGLQSINTGKIVVQGENMPNIKLSEKIGYMAQSDALYHELTAYENLQFFSSLYKVTGNMQKERIKEVSQLVNLSDHLHKPVQKYSGGMKRRLSLAISLLHEPEILILDEPTVGIDPLLRRSIWKELKYLSERGTTVLVTTHVMDEAQKCDRLAMLRDGKILAVGSEEELMRKTEATTMEEAFLVFGGASV